MKPFAWTCPYCQKATLITDANYDRELMAFETSTASGKRGFVLQMTTCPNPDCKQYQIVVTEHDTGYSNGSFGPEGRPVANWMLRPNSKAIPLPVYVPAAIVEDYNEACLIRDLSPKASATLSRRCLQGMIRDFHQVKPGNLFNEINEIKDKIDAVTWAGIDAVRKVGNIGAHMEKDVDVIVDVEPEEAQLLIGLIETLIKEWYVARHDRKQAMDALIKLAADKDAAKKPQTPP
ncbi:DUF4145 domain-containing protein [Luteibacter aegosomatis]|uniref:DUF4145 domain-containing protein n=1 Tax=Luteibacter aegosomatis TaxID=2911537 RepID=UPI001FF98A6C|nr:DUF4145 domain-containing protein [Luteibacter aegosomatis]UPG87073.1 DUF4145 domain-containing protein [Luteibacter aegosomatis]